MAYQQGDIVLIPFPFTDLSASKTRPAVVISIPDYEKNFSDVLLAFVSSRMRNVIPEFDHTLVDWRGAGLLRPSFIRPKIAAIDTSLIVHKIGVLNPTDLRNVELKLKVALGL